MIIKQLDSSIYNKIAAGEVVERPRSVVKELVENAIDAGANRVTISIIDGGKTLIEVSDNGCGIQSEYIKTAFLPHATSKINTVDDLFTISTLGFRGEALASIASISQVIVQSQCTGTSNGVQLIVEGGVFGEILPWSGADGTTFIVKNIFYNTPAREKFLKTPRGEESEISSLVQQFIIANPNVSINYRVDNKLVYSSQGNGLMDSLYTVYDKSLTESLLQVNFLRGAISVQGYISKPSYTKGTRNYQTTIINGRVVNNNSISVAVNQGYAQTLMKRAFPVYVLEITMPFEQVDVNVNPNKSDVRFSDNKLIFSAIYNAVKETLDKYASSSAINLLNIKGEDNGKIIDSNIINEQSVFSDNANLSDNNINFPSNTSKINTNLELLQKKIGCDNNTVNQVQQNELLNRIKNIQSNSVKTKTFNNIVADNYSPINFDINVLPINNIATSLATVNKSSPDSIASFISEQLSVEDCESKDINVIGQIFNAYLIIAKGNKMYILDQHACHERLIYDQLTKQISDGAIAVQPLLIPQIYSLNPNDFDIIMNFCDELSKIGINIEEFGTYTVKVNQIPVVMQHFNLKNFIEEILTSSRFSKVKLSEILKDKLAMTACKASIRGGEKLNDYEINSLIDMMKDNLPLQCPHGRPAVITFDKKDIDKMFKRIL